MKNKLFLIIFSLLVINDVCFAQMEGGDRRPPMDGGGKGGMMRPEDRGRAERKMKRESEKRKEDLKDGNGKTKGVVYLFGFSRSFGDSLVYITDLNKVDSLALEKKTRFLPYRYEFSLQFEEYLEGERKLSRQTTCVFFGKSKKKMQKRLAKMKKRYLNMDNVSIVNVSADEFNFMHPVDRFRLYE